MNHNFTTRRIIRLEFHTSFSGECNLSFGDTRYRVFYLTNRGTLIRRSGGQTDSTCWYKMAPDGKVREISEP